MPSSVMDHESLKILAQWLKSHGGYRFKADDPRRLLDGRYPQGLISEAELEALMAVWH
ncbi:Uncharacterised protein [Pseudomonas putida]|nr:Uncharacterised protein [Pseudomonas putida]SDC86933.1 hypothetical protein SAMN05216185_104376 [Pseudomonas guariconensis]CAB5521331.1 Uncharacterised protein [Pseudomonas putida]CAB5553035.1 Uncharacterised protein [Pseudomonas putida]CAB5553196.1 Uncharacterised protein [Pseudomonas putida]